MSLKFLNMKGFHPANKTNQKRIWIAEQKAKAREAKEQECAEELRKAAELREFQQIAAAKGDMNTARRMESQQVGFLYEPPPGLPKNAKEKVESGTEDEAVQAFRRKVESKTDQNKRENQRNLERYVGHRPDENITIQDQVERFPFLKDAPVEGQYTDSVKVNFKPLGIQLRNVRCLRCNEWGHQSGDRECKLRHINPHDAARQMREDPLSAISQHKTQQSQKQFVLKQSALPLELQQEHSSRTTDEFPILLSDSEDKDLDREQAYLATLSSKEKKKLLHKLKKEKRREKKRLRNEKAHSNEYDTHEDHHRDRKRKKDGKVKKKRKTSISPGPSRRGKR